jgi:hypothetical protein
VSGPSWLALVLGVIALGPSSAGASTLGPFVNPANGHAYYVTDDVLTWAACEAWATALGGRLVSINDSMENAWIVGNLPMESDAYWIGGRDDANTSDDVFIWDSGEPWTYSNWSQGEPDDEVAIGGQGDYVSLSRGTGTWFDSNGFNPVRGGIAEAVPTTGVDDGSRPSIPGALSLRAFPSGDGVTVRCELAREMAVQVQVFDVHGRPMRTVYTGVLPAGTRDLHWDRLDGRGRVVAPGLYFVSARAEGIRRTGRIAVAQ